MARFDVFANPGPAERRTTPYLVDVQNDFIDSFSTRVVIPLRRESTFGARARDLNPAFTVGADAVVLDTAALGAVPLAELRMPVASLREHRIDIQNALDALFGSY